jgi:hypothetical protein
MTAGNNHNNKSSPVVATSGMHVSGTAEARLLGSAFAGVAELAIFHPIDTVAKRLMTNQTKVVVAGFGPTVHNLNVAVFRDAAAAGPFTKATSLFPGIGFGAVYKILQRVYKFGGQPVVRDWMQNKYGKDFEAEFGPKLGKTMVSATAGSIIGVGEVVLLPLDALKIKAQTAPDQIKGRGLLDIFKTEGWSLYRGAGWTAARNAPGSFALFGGNAFAKSLMGITESQQATWTQDAIASCTGAVASITVAQPLDVIKTRIQHQPFDKPQSGITVVTSLVKNEGLGAFFKGLTPKLLVIGPKLVFSFTVAQHSIAYFTKLLDPAHAS